MKFDQRQFIQPGLQEETSESIKEANDGEERKG